jgi:TRAP-type mannitol/chloroaromatic compound transport system permease small subunit
MTPLRILLAICRHIDSLNRWIGRAMAWCILASVLISTANAVMRKAFGLSSNSWVEMQWYLYAAAFLLAAGYVLMVDEHVRVDALAQRLSPRLRAGFDVVVLLLFVLPLCALMVDLGGAYFWDAYRHAEHSFMADGLIVWPVRLLIPLGFGLLGLQALSEIVKRIDFLRGGRPRAVTTEDDLPEFMGVAPTDGRNP